MRRLVAVMEAANACSPRSSIGDFRSGERDFRARGFHARCPSVMSTLVEHPFCVLETDPIDPTRRNCKNKRGTLMDRVVFVECYRKTMCFVAGHFVH